MKLLRPFLFNFRTILLLIGLILHSQCRILESGTKDDEDEFLSPNSLWTDIQEIEPENAILPDRKGKALIWHKNQDYWCLKAENSYRWSDGCTYQTCSCSIPKDEEEDYCIPDRNDCNSDFFSSRSAIDEVARKHCCKKRLKDKQRLRRLFPFPLMK